MSSKDFLFEIGTEELPPKAQQNLARQLGENLQLGLAKMGLSYGETRVFSTPRRIAVWIKSVLAAQPSYMVEKRGPALAAAFDAEGNPTLACLGFANSCNATVEELQTEKNDKGAWVFFKREQSGEQTTKLLPEIVRQAVAQLSMAKPMRWGNQDISFIRPVHWIVLLFGKKVVTAEILGKRTGRQTYGHRFHHPASISIPHPSEYLTLLPTTGKVIADAAARKEKIAKQLANLKIKKHPEGRVLIDPALLEEVTCLVEWPAALSGEFDPIFLEIPQEAIITAMKSHQKCFSVVNPEGNVLPSFVTLSNIESRDAKRVVHGNERVIRARLADAQFFYHSDLKQRLETRLEELKKVLFHKKLGTMFEKAQRISGLAAYLAKELSSSVSPAQRAGLLAKADLMSAMVGEFPELQGIMGYYYALADGETEAVAVAIREQYQPRFSGDVLPETELGCLISVAEKIDTIIGLFGANQPPSGEKDPFGLRRAALGVLRILIEKQLPIDLLALLKQAAQLYETPLENIEAATQAFEFMLERLRTFYLDRGIDAHVFAAVVARVPTQPLDFDRRVQAVQHFQTLSQANALTAAYKRVSHILKDQKGEWQHQPLDEALLELKAERKLVSALEKKYKEIEKLSAATNYTEILTTLADLQAPVDQFFEDVMVMVENEKQRNNRLALLHQLRQLFLHVADISAL